ncbi:CBS domain-containing protein [Flavobacterium sp. ASV13]|uniref:CBS domain-containing protein n=1 Tax=Flavobacterium sp. ASV13 TaxID=1506583 RepID=UPI00054DD484|nr:CBS domain-containing protein [Flavobacterium sp. ASV13]
MEENKTNSQIAIMILSVSFLVIILMAIYYMCHRSDPEKLFAIILPVISTWVGTILAFYFGKANFEAATKSYNQVIDRLTPDILDDILVKQIMIDKFTMVSLDTDDSLITKFDLKGLRDFLDSIKKSRLPILEKGKVKCIIHKSTLSDEMLKTPPATTLDEFIKANHSVIEFENINQDKKVEDARKIMNEKNYKDLFVIDANNELTGWLTDTQIIRYMNNQKI